MTVQNPRLHAQEGKNDKKEKQERVSTTVASFSMAFTTEASMGMLYKP